MRKWFFEVGAKENNQRANVLSERANASTEKAHFQNLKTIEVIKAKLKTQKNELIMKEQIKMNKEQTFF